MPVVLSADEQNWLSVRWQAEAGESESVYLTIEIPFISITQEWVD